MNNKLDTLNIKGKAWRGEIPASMKAQMSSEQIAEIHKHLKEKIQFWVRKIDKYATDEMREHEILMMINRTFPSQKIIDLVRKKTGMVLTKEGEL